MKKLQSVLMKLIYRFLILVGLLVTVWVTQTRPETTGSILIILVCIWVVLLYSLLVAIESDVRYTQPMKQVVLREDQ